MGELVDRSELRVCADPASLPLSNEQGEGFENKIAELLAEHLGVRLVYTWYPNALGFVRNTLRAGRCDLILGVVAADELVQNTNPYYRSSYVLAYRSADADRFADLDSPLMQLARIGVVAGTPPVDLLARKGLAGQIRGYELMVDSRVEQPARQAIEDLAGGQLDAALVWGPIAAYWAKLQPVPITITPLRSDPRTGLRLDFRISMGIRPNEPEWKHQINDLIRELQPQIQGILLDYGVPLLDEQDRPITAEGTAVGHLHPMSRSRRATGWTSTGRRCRPRWPGPRCCRRRHCEQLIAEQQPVLVDVLPKQRKPKDRDQAQIWIEPKREHIPGSAWLPNVGLGELSPDFAEYFATELAKLTGGDKAKPVVFYCDANCWMSWNAGKRALTELGYTPGLLVPGGRPGLETRPGKPLETAQVIPMPEFGQ